MKADRILEMLPDALDKIEGMIKSKNEAKAAETPASAETVPEVAE